MEFPNFPTRLMNQSFGLCITPDDVILPSPSILSPNYYRPWKWYMQDNSKEFCSAIDNEKNRFVVSLDVQHFKPSEINVKIINKEICIEGKHEERLDEHGFVSRQFTRRYKMPDNCNFEDVDANLSSDGVLKISVSKKNNIIKDEISVPIKFCESFSKVETNKSDTLSDTKKQMYAEKDSKTCKGTKASDEMNKNSSLMIKDEMIKEEINNKTLMEEKRTSPSYVDDLIMESKKKIDELFKITGGTASSAIEDASLKITMSDKVGGSMSMSEEICQKSSELVAESSCMSTTAESSSMSTTETCSFSSMTSETMKSQESAAAAFMTSSMKSKSDKTETLSEKITEALKDAVENL